MKSLRSVPRMQVTNVATGRSATERQVVTLCYHAMADGERLDLRDRDRRLQGTACRLLDEEGYESVLPSQIADYLEGTGDLPEKAVCITFDDGPESILTVSKPAMDAHGYVGAAFLIADSVGAGGNLTWDQVRELEAAGWEIGSHTACHEKATKAWMTRRPAMAELRAPARRSRPRSRATARRWPTRSASTTRACERSCAGGRLPDRVHDRPRPRGSDDRPDAGAAADAGGRQLAEDLPRLAGAGEAASRGRDARRSASG
jgi:hypothetical protein